MSNLPFFVESSLRNEKLAGAAIIDEVKRTVESVDKDALQQVFQLLIHALLTRSFEDKDTTLTVIEFCARMKHVATSDWQDLSKCCLSVFGTAYCDRLVCQHGELPCTLKSWVLVPFLTRDVKQFLFVSSSAPSGITCPGSTGLARDSLTAGDWKFLNVLVRFGLWNGMLYQADWAPSTELWSVYMFARRRFQQLMFVCTTIADKMWLELKENRGRMLSHNQRGFRRITLITKAILALAIVKRQEYSKAEDLVRCFKLLFVTLPDPLVSADEVGDFLRYLLSYGRDGERVPDQSITEFVDEWAELFGRHPYMPRSLTHFCRCVVRTALVEKSDTLPNLVERLEIPRTLKDFLLGNPDSRLTAVKPTVAQVPSASIDHGHTNETTVVVTGGNIIVRLPSRTISAECSTIANVSLSNNQ